MLKVALKKYAKSASLIVSIVLIVAIGKNVWNLAGKPDALEEARQRLLQLEKEQAELLELKERVESEEFIEREAREKLGLAKEGEVVVVLPPEDVLRRLAPKIEEEESPEKLPIWKRWVRMFFGYGN